MKKFYITTTLPYVNADPHIGFAAEIVRADTIARYRRMAGDDVFFNTGTDEHGLKIYRKAAEQGMDPQTYVDDYAARFDRLKKALNLSYNSFTRTSDKQHMEAAREFWRRCDNNGDIYKKKYQVRYCVGCESEKSDSDLVHGKCPDHPNLELEIIDEENYFFRFSKYQDKLTALYDENPDFVHPKTKQNEIRNFVSQGLNDFSISRLKEKMPWGVEVPGDPEHVMYVWFDALVNYISCLGWPGKSDFGGYWPGMQVAGKDNLRFQTAMWQAMLMSASLPNSALILIFGFITSGGQKMSKSLGNVVNPFDLVEKYGTDAVRYYLLGDLNMYEDSDYTQEKFEARYTADLANGLGNLVARSIALAGKMAQAGIKIPDCVARPADDEALEKWGGKEFIGPVATAWRDYRSAMDNFALDRAIAVVMAEERYLDNYITENEPWKMIKANDGSVAVVMYNVLERLRHVALMLLPFLPVTAEEILRRLGLDPAVETKKDLTENAAFELLPHNTKILAGNPLFPRLQN